MNKRFGKNDIILIIILALMAIALYAGFYVFNNKSGNYAIVEVDGKEYGNYSLEQDQEIDIENKNGEITNHLSIKNGKANMIEANCPDKLCVHQKAISKHNETIVCLPNKVVVTVISDAKSDIDAVTN